MPRDSISAFTPSAPILSSLSTATRAVPCSASGISHSVQNRREQLPVIQADREVVKPSSVNASDTAAHSSASMAGEVEPSASTSH